ncbi:hypothetical protein SLA2020_439870 [Shorea laevis]
MDLLLPLGHLQVPLRKIRPSSRFFICLPQMEERKMSYVLERVHHLYMQFLRIQGSNQERHGACSSKAALSPSTYKHYFAALLYAEDFYLEVLMNALRYCCFELAALSRT